MFPKSVRYTKLVEIMIKQGNIESNSQNNHKEIYWFHIPENILIDYVYYP